MPLNHMQRAKREIHSFSTKRPIGARCSRRGPSRWTCRLRGRGGPRPLRRAGTPYPPQPGAPWTQPTQTPDQEAAGTQPAHRSKRVRTYSSHQSKSPRRAAPHACVAKAPRPADKEKTHAVRLQLFNINHLAAAPEQLLARGRVVDELRPRDEVALPDKLQNRRAVNQDLE